MKLISINIELNKHYNTVFNFIKKENPDVVCLQELLEDDFNRFKKELNMEGVFKAFSYFKKHPCYDENLVGKKQGVAIFSKNIEDSGSIFYVGKEDNLFKSYEEYLSNEKNMKNVVLVWANIKNKEDIKYKFINTHLPVTKEGESSPYQLETVDALLIKLDTLGEFILCGDMNAPRGNETFTRLEKKYKDNIPLKYKTSLDQNLHRVKCLQYMVDGLFTTSTYKALNVRLEDGISDHMAIVADISKD